MVRIDPYLYLEEMGLTWFVQRGVLAEQALQQQKRSDLMHIPNGSSSPLAPASPKTNNGGLLSSLRWSNKRSPTAAAGGGAQSGSAASSSAPSPKSRQQQQFYNNTNVIRAQQQQQGKQRTLASIKHFAATDRALVGTITEAVNMSMAQFSLIPDTRAHLVATTPYNLLGTFLPRVIQATSLSAVNVSEECSKSMESQLCLDLIDRMAQINAEAAVNALEFRSTFVKHRSASLSTNSVSNSDLDGSGKHSDPTMESSPSKLLRKIGSSIMNSAPSSPGHQQQQQGTSLTSKWFSASSSLFRSNKSSPVATAATGTADTVADDPNRLSNTSNGSNTRTGTTAEQLQKLSETLDFDAADDEEDEEDDDDEDDDDDDTNKTDTDAEAVTKRQIRRRRSSTAKRRNSAQANANTLIDTNTSGSLANDDAAANEETKQSESKFIEVPAASQNGESELDQAVAVVAGVTDVSSGGDGDGDGAVDNSEEVLKERENKDWSGIAAVQENIDTDSDNGTEKASSAAASTPARRLNLAAIQQNIVELLQQDMQRSGTAVGIHSYSPCECGFALTDEELMTVWSHSCLYDSHVKGNRRSRKARNMCAVHTVSCRSCGEAMVPRLHIRHYSRDARNTPKDTAENLSLEHSSELKVLFSDDVPHLSPMALRYELESVLQYWGSAAVDAVWLQENNPALLWGTIWYTTRLNIPSGLLLLDNQNNTLPQGDTIALSVDASGDNSAVSSPAGNSIRSSRSAAHRNASISMSVNEVLLHGSDGATGSSTAGQDVADHDNNIGSSSSRSSSRVSILPGDDSYDAVKADKVIAALRSGIVVGWREAAVKAKLRRWMNQDFSLNPSVTDIFPECGPEDEAMLRAQVATKLDGSPAGLRAAMVSFIECPGIVKHLESWRMPRGRAVYLGLLSLCYILEASSLVVPPLLSSTAKRLKKELPFERVYQEAIRCVVSKADLEMLGATEQELLAAYPGKEAIAMRNGLGFLF